MRKTRKQWKQEAREWRANFHTAWDLCKKWEAHVDKLLNADWRPAEEDATPRDREIKALDEEIWRLEAELKEAHRQTEGLKVQRFEPGGVVASLPLSKVMAEIERQYQLYGAMSAGGAALSVEQRLDTLRREVEELAEAVLRGDLNGPHGIYVELTQVAAVALSWLGRQTSLSWADPTTSEEHFHEIEALKEELAEAQLALQCAQRTLLSAELSGVDITACEEHSREISDTQFHEISRLKNELALHQVFTTPTVRRVAELVAAQHRIYGEQPADGAPLVNEWRLEALDEWRDELGRLLRGGHRPGNALRQIAAQALAWLEDDL